MHVLMAVATYNFIWTRTCFLKVGVASCKLKLLLYVFCNCNPTWSWLVRLTYFLSQASYNRSNNFLHRCLYSKTLESHPYGSHFLLCDVIAETLFCPKMCFSLTTAATVLYHGSTFAPLCAPILSLQPCNVTICSRHVMASVWDMKIAEELLILFLANYVLKRVRHCWN